RAVKPSASYSPIALYSSHAHAQGARDLLFGQAGDETNFHNVRLARIDGFETLECFVQGQELQGSISDPDPRVGESDFQAGLGTFFRLPGSGVIDKNAPHHLCGYRKKMRTILPIHLILVDQSEVSL